MPRLRGPAARIDHHTRGVAQLFTVSGRNPPAPQDSLGTYQLQVDLASSEVLRDAQAHPEGYDDLFVRIGGYLVPFTLLGPKAQEDIIARTELEL